MEQMCVPKVAEVGVEPTRTLLPTRFSYYYGFHHHKICVCSLDYTFTISYDLGVPCLVSTPSSLLRLGSVLAVKPSPNLRNSTLRVSSHALKLYKSCMYYLFHHSAIISIMSKNVMHLSHILTQI